MKKLESVVHGELGCGKPRYAAAFPLILFGPRSPILPKKLIMKRGEGTALALGNPTALVFSRQDLR